MNSGLSRISDTNKRKWIMRANLTTFIILLTLMQVSAASFGQNLTLRERNISYSKLFFELRKQTGYNVLIESTEFNASKRINADFRNASIDLVMKEIIKGNDLDYDIEEKTVVIKPRERTFIDRLIERFQTIDVRGKVVDEAGNGLPGASIKVKGLSKQTTTDANGEFTLSGVADDAVILISYIGFQGKEVKVAKELGSIKLDVLTNPLDQVKIIGYGTTTQRLSTGNVGKITSETIAQQPVTNALSAMAGRISGVEVISNGRPGQGISVKIRGRNSIVAKNNPLYIVDGVPFMTEGTGSELTNSLITISPLNVISPNDIESISVLKDADATSIYGSRAANGVILITTKKGREGKTNYEFKVDRGFNTASRLGQLLSTAQYLQLRKDAFANSGITPTAASAPDLMTWDQNLDNKWQDWYIDKTADMWNASLSVSGGNQQVSYLISGNFHQEGSITSSSDKYRRSNLHVNLGHTSKDNRLNIQFSSIFGADYNYQQSVVSFGSVVNAIPNYPIYDAAGNFNWLNGLTNLIASSQGYNKINADNLNLGLNARYKIVGNLEFIANLGYGRNQNEAMRPMPKTFWDPSWGIGSVNNFGNETIRTSLAEPQLSYSTNFAKGKLSALVGSTIQERESSTRRATVMDFVNDLLIESPTAGTIAGYDGNTIQYKYLSFFGRLSYNWQDKYLINGTLRRDGSSRFGTGNKFGNFGSVGVAWLFGNEQLIKNNLKWLSHGKLRGSYGTTGSDGIGDYAYLSLYSIGTAYGTTQSISPLQIGNTAFQWEATKKLEASLELGLFDDRFLFMGTWYRNRSNNQLVTYPLPATTGFTGYISNLPATVENRGWEFELTSNNINREDFTWNTSINLTLPKNRLVDFPNIALTSYANTYVIGQSLNSYLGYKFDKIDPLTGLAQFIDLNNNAAVSANSMYNGQNGDKTYIGTTDAQWFGGINNSLSWKGLKLDVFFQYSKQKGYNLYYSQNGFGSFGQLQNGWVEYLDYWKSPSSPGTLPKPFASFNTTLSQFSQSDRGFSDASFLRLKTLALSYQFKIRGIQRLEIYAQGQNLWTLTKYMGYDPERSAGSSISLPTMKSITFGLKTTL